MTTVLSHRLHQLYLVEQALPKEVVWHNLIPQDLALTHQYLLHTQN